MILTRRRPFAAQASALVVVALVCIALAVVAPAEAEMLLQYPTDFPAPVASSTNTVRGVVVDNLKFTAAGMVNDTTYVFRNCTVRFVELGTALWLAGVALRFENCTLGFGRVDTNTFFLMAGTLLSFRDCVLVPVAADGENVALPLNVAMLSQTASLEIVRCSLKLLRSADEGGIQIELLQPPRGLDFVFGAITIANNSFENAYKILALVSITAVRNRSPFLITGNSINLTDNVARSAAQVAHIPDAAVMMVKTRDANLSVTSFTVARNTFVHNFSFAYRYKLSFKDPTHLVSLNCIIAAASSTLVLLQDNRATTFTNVDVLPVSSSRVNMFELRLETGSGPGAPQQLRVHGINNTYDVTALGRVTLYSIILVGNVAEIFVTDCIMACRICSRVQLASLRTPQNTRASVDTIVVRRSFASGYVSKMPEAEDSNALVLVDFSATDGDDVNRTLFERLGHVLFENNTATFSCYGRSTGVLFMHWVHFLERFEVIGNVFTLTTYTGNPGSKYPPETTGVEFLWFVRTAPGDIRLLNNTITITTEVGNHAAFRLSPDNNMSSHVDLSAMNIVMDSNRISMLKREGVRVADSYVAGVYVTFVSTQGVPPITFSNNNVSIFAAQKCPTLGCAGVLFVVGAQLVATVQYARSLVVRGNNISVSGSGGISAAVSVTLIGGAELYSFFPPGLKSLPSSLNLLANLSVVGNAATVSNTEMAAAIACPITGFLRIGAFVAVNNTFSVNADQVQQRPSDAESFASAMSCGCPRGKISVEQLGPSAGLTLACEETPTLILDNVVVHNLTALGASRLFDITALFNASNVSISSVTAPDIAGFRDRSGMSSVMRLAVELGLNAQQASKRVPLQRIERLQFSRCNFSSVCDCEKLSTRELNGVVYAPDHTIAELRLDGVTARHRCVSSQASSPASSSSTSWVFPLLRAAWIGNVSLMTTNVSVVSPSNAALSVEAVRLCGACTQLLSGALSTLAHASLQLSNVIFTTPRFDDRVIGRDALESVDSATIEQLARVAEISTSVTCATWNRKPVQQQSAVWRASQFEGTPSTMRVLPCNSGFVPSSTRSATRSKSHEPTHSRSLTKTYMPPPPRVKPFRMPLTARVLVSLSAAVLSTGSVTHGFKLSVLTLARQCGAGDEASIGDNPLAFDSNPLFVTIGSGPLETYRGAAVGNIVFAGICGAAMAAVMFALVKLRHCSVGKAKRMIRFPSTFQPVVVVIGLPSCVVFAALLSTPSPGGLEIGLSIAPVALFFVYPTAMCIHVFRRCRATERLVEPDGNDDGDGSSSSSSRSSSRASSNSANRRGTAPQPSALVAAWRNLRKSIGRCWGFLNDQWLEWRDSEFLKYYGLWFEGFSLPWYALVDFLVASTMGIAGGVGLNCTTAPCCAGTAIYSAVAAAVHTGCVVFARPFMNRIDVVLETAMSVATLVTALLVVAGEYGAEVETASDVVAYVSLMLTFSGIIMTVLPLIEPTVVWINDHVRCRVRRSKSGGGGGDDRESRMTAHRQPWKRVNDDDRYRHRRDSSNSNGQRRDDREHRHRSFEAPLRGPRRYDDADGRDSSRHRDRTHSGSRSAQRQINLHELARIPSKSSFRLTRNDRADSHQQQAHQRFDIDAALLRGGGYDQQRTRTPRRDNSRVDVPRERHPGGVREMRHSNDERVVASNTHHIRHGDQEPRRGAADRRASGSAPAGLAHRSP